MDTFTLLGGAPTHMYMHNLLYISVKLLHNLLRLLLCTVPVAAEIECTCVCYAALCQVH